jgi:hypothetical protein
VAQDQHQITQKAAMVATVFGAMAPIQLLVLVEVPQKQLIIRGELVERLLAEI